MKKESLKKFGLLLPIVPVILLEAFILNRSVASYLANQKPGALSPDSQIALENTSAREMVLGASVNAEITNLIERLLLIAIAFLVIGLIFLWFEVGSKQSSKSKS